MFTTSRSLRSISFGDGDKSPLLINARRLAVQHAVVAPVAKQTEGVAGRQDPTISWICSLKGSKHHDPRLTIDGHNGCHGLLRTERVPQIARERQT